MLLNKSNARWCKRSAVRCLIEDKKCKSKKRGIILEKLHFELPPLIASIAVWIVNTYSEFQQNIFSKKRYYKMSNVQENKHNDDSKAIAIPLVFSKNGRAKDQICLSRIENIEGKGENAGYQHFLLFHKVFIRPFPQVNQQSSLCGRDFNMTHQLYMVRHYIVQCKQLDLEKHTLDHTLF